MGVFAQIIGWIGMVLGGVRVALSLWVAFSFEGEEKELAIHTYLGSFAYIGESIDKGTILFLVGLAFVLLGTIARRTKT